jgi:hypothetical protein
LLTQAALQLDWKNLSNFNFFSKKLLTGAKKAKRQPEVVGVRNNLQEEFYGDFSHLCFAGRKKFLRVAKVSAVLRKRQPARKLAQAQVVSPTAEVAFYLPLSSASNEREERSDETEHAQGTAGDRGGGIVGRTGRGRAPPVQTGKRRFH